MSNVGIPASWTLTKVQDEIELARVNIAVSADRSAYQELWRDYECRLRDRATVLTLTAELDELEGRS